MGGVQVLPGDIILADDEGALAMPLDLAEYIAAHGPQKEAPRGLDPRQDRRRAARFTTTTRRPAEKLAEYDAGNRAAQRRPVNPRRGDA